jgi:chitin synthase
VWNSGIYDLTDYFNTVSLNLGTQYQFLNESVTDLFEQRIGQDITKELDAALADMDTNTREATTACLNNLFYLGETDFRKTPRCQVQNWLLLGASIVIMSSMGLKCELCPAFNTSNCLINDRIHQSCLHCS